MAGSGKGITVTIEKIASGGAGLGRIDGKVVFVPFTLPGETVEAELQEVKKDYLRAKALRIVSPSPERIEPACPLFGVCGGCDFQHLGYQAQLDLKRGLFLEAFRRIGGEDLPPPEVVPSEPFGYRARVQVHRAGKGVGFKEAGGSGVVQVKVCPVASPEVNAFLSEAQAGSGEFSRERFTVFGWGGAWFREGRDREARAVIRGRAFSFAPECFFQSNPAMLERLAGEVGELLPGGEAALDLYGGVGTFAAFLADSYERVTLVEESPLAAAWAERNLEGGRAEVFRGNVEAWLRTAAARRPADAVVVDPPRTGLSEDVVRFLGLAKPRRLVYVSCDAATLARDFKKLKTLGFRLDRYRVYDFYPQTAHLESLCVFSLA